MQAAIETLRIALENVTNNEPIHRADGRVGQELLCAKQRQEFQLAIWLLEGVELAPLILDQVLKLATTKRA